MQLKGVLTMQALNLPDGFNFKSPSWLNPICNECIISIANFAFHDQFIGFECACWNSDIFIRDNFYVILANCLFRATFVKLYCP